MSAKNSIVNIFLYNIFLQLYTFSVHAFALANPKAKAWRNGRQKIFNRISKALQTNKKVVWMHCASLGEFEQGQPLLEMIKKTAPKDYTLLLTFFSPSGYEAKKNYEGADYIFYLPMDSAQNAKRFFDIVNPRLVLFVKYEFWYYYLSEARKRKIPLILVSGIFRAGQPFFKWYGNLHRQMLACFTWIFLQNLASAKLLSGIGIENNVVVNGDTRFDRVLEIAALAEPLPLVELFCGVADVVVAGSTWTEDDRELDHFANTHSKARFIIAPHNVGLHRIQECLSLYKNAITYTQLQTQSGAVPPHINTLIIDNIGMLSRLYKYATIAYVGGGFGGDGVHNVLEPAVYGIPVVFGPEYKKFAEAVELVERGGAISVANPLQLEQTFSTLLGKGDDYYAACRVNKDYVLESAGATQRIVNFIQAKRLFTS